MNYSNYDLVQPIRFFIRILKTIGLWRLDNQWELYYRIYSYLLHFFVSFLMLVTLWVCVFTSQNIEEFFESLYMALTEAALMAKVINIQILSREAVNFFILFEDNAVRPSSPKEMKIFEQEQRVFNFILKFYFSASVLVMVAVITVVVVGTKYVLAYPAWMPFELESEYYWYAFGFQFIGLLVTLMANTSIDALQCYLLHHISLIYQMVGHRLENLGSRFDGETDAELERLIHGEFVGIVKSHKLLKRLLAECERFTSLPFFTQILLNALVLCFTGYQLSDMSPLKDFGPFLSTVDFLFVMSMQIFLPCYYADKMTTQADQLGVALYSSNWTHLPKSSRKLICLYMEFLREPVCVRAGNYFSIGIPIFAKTMNNAYSFFALLLRMKE